MKEDEKISETGNLVVFQQNQRNKMTLLIKAKSMWPFVLAEKLESSCRIAKKKCKGRNIFQVWPRYTEY